MPLVCMEDDDSSWTSLSSCPLLSLDGGQPFPEALKVHRAESAIVQAVARTATFAPDHAPVVRTHRAGEASLAQGTQHREHVHITECRRMRCLVKAARPGDFHVATMHEVDPVQRAEPSYHCRQI